MQVENNFPSGFILMSLIWSDFARPSSLSQGYTTLWIYRPQETQSVLDYMIKQVVKGMGTPLKGWSNINTTRHLDVGIGYHMQMKSSYSGTVIT